MKILFAIAERYPTHRQDVMALFGKYLPRLGISSDLLTLHFPSEQPVSWPGGKLISKPVRASRIVRHLQVFFNDLRLLWLAHRGYDALQVRDKALAALVGLIAARLAGIPFFYWMSFPIAEAHAVLARERGMTLGIGRWAFAFGRARIMALLLYKIVLPRADHIFVQSERMREEMTAKGIPPEKMTPVPMGFDPDGIPRVTRDDALPCRNTFVYLGTLNRVRNPEVMVDAIDRLRHSHPAVRLLLIGDADEAADRTWLLQRIERLELRDHIELTGWLPLNEGWGRAARCLAGLSPFPRSELLESASPTKAVEYYALGLPVIGNDQPDQALVLAGAGAEAVTLDAAAFAQAMAALLDHPETRVQQGQAGRDWVRAHRSYPRLAEIVANIYLGYRKQRAGAT